MYKMVQCCKKKIIWKWQQIWWIIQPNCNEDSQNHHCISSYSSEKVSTSRPTHSVSWFWSKKDETRFLQVRPLPTQISSAKVESSFMRSKANDESRLFLQKTHLQMVVLYTQPTLKQSLGTSVEKTVVTHKMLRRCCIQNLLLIIFKARWRSELEIKNLRKKDLLECVIWEKNW